MAGFVNRDNDVTWIRVLLLVNKDPEFFDISIPISLVDILENSDECHA